MDETMAERWKTLAEDSGGPFSMLFLRKIDFRYVGAFYRLASGRVPTTENGTVDIPWLSWNELVPVRDRTALREGHWIRQLAKHKFLRPADIAGPSDLCHATLLSSHDPAESRSPRLSLLTTWTLRSNRYRTSVRGTIKASLDDGTEEHSGLELALMPWWGTGGLGRVPLDMNDTYYVSIDSLHIEHFYNALRIRERRRAISLKLWVDATITVEPRSDLTRIGRSLQTNAQILSVLIEQGQLSLRDVQNLALASRSVAVSLKEETTHRLRKALAPYFPDGFDKLLSLMREHEAVISGSTILSILKPGDWTPGDLDIILPEPSLEAFETFLKSLGYVLDFDALFDEDACYDSDDRYARRLYIKGSQKIDLCGTLYIHTPLSHVLGYHSTPVMNYFDGKTVYCLFPEQTFAGVMLRNDDHIGKEERRWKALDKVRKRGFIETGIMSSWMRGDYSPPHTVELRHLPTIWKQDVELHTG